jgi:hypothetical protein
MRNENVLLLTVSVLVGIISLTVVGFSQVKITNFPRKFSVILTLHDT